MHRSILLLALSLLTISCDNNDGSENEPILFGCDVAQQNMYVHNLLKDVYLWYREVPDDIDYKAFSSPEQLLDFLRYDPFDRFSTITDAQQFNDLLIEGRDIGYGLSFLTDSGRLRFVYRDSSAGRAGLQRGDQLLTLNGEDLADIALANDWDRVLGPDVEGTTLDIVVRRPDGSTFGTTLTKGTININTVLHSGIIAGQATPTGYLVFNSFLATSVEELESAFATFHAEGVRRLILDLRYNRGGSVLVASLLASYLNRVDNDNQLFTRLTYNDKHPELNQAYYLGRVQNALSLDQIIVITTGETCSASEMIISGLEPYAAEVLSVGSTTCGKPVGMSGREFCGKLILPVMFESRNRRGEGEYYNGIAADCGANDSPTLDFGNSGESMLSEALFLANNGQCSASGRAARSVAVPTTSAIDSPRAILGAY